MVERPQPYTPILNISALARDCAGFEYNKVGSSPSGFTTRETKVHVVCESKLDNWRSRLVCLGTFLAEPAKFMPQYFIEKS